MNKYSFLAIAASATVLTALLSTHCTGPQEGTRTRPCDIYASGGTPCVAAHSTTRILKSGYDGPLYRVVRDSDGAVLDIFADAQGYADVRAFDEFSRGGVCRISVIYDQSGMGNDLTQAAPGTFKGPDKGEYNTLPLADMAPVTIAGRKAYGVYIIPGMGFRCNNARGLAINDEAEGIYYVVDGTHYNSGCCFDYGNSSTNGKAVGRGTMETTYYGTSTNWGSGNGEGPWIMADMEGGLFSGYNAKKNDVPSIDGWRFVSVFVNGGDGNRWDLRGGDATLDSLVTYYEGIRPGSEEDSSYYPMHKKGGMLLGNGGDNGNGSSGTFYEGVMTRGYPDEATVKAVQANIAAAAYREYPLELSRLVQFTPGAKAELSVLFRNVSGEDIKGLEISAALPEGWKAEGGAAARTLAKDKSLTAVFTITAPEGRSAGEVEIKAAWKGGESAARQRIRCSEALKINEILLRGEAGGTEQFIEILNASASDVSTDGLALVARHSGKAPLGIYSFPKGGSIPAGGFVCISLADNAVTADAEAGGKEVYLLNQEAAGSSIGISGKEYRIVGTGKAAAAPSTIFSPVSTGPRITVPAGSTSIPVTSTAGFAAGDMMGIDLGGRYETVRVTSVGTAATQSTIPDATKKGDTVIRIDATSGLRPGDVLTISTGDRTERIKVKRIIKNAAAPEPRRPGMPFTVHEPGVVELESPLQSDHIAGIDVSCPGSGISFEPATAYEHCSGDEIRPLGTAFTLDRALETGVRAFEGLNGESRFGYPLATTAGSVALIDTEKNVVVDAVIYGSKQSDSSANGTVASPELAVLESPQDGGGNIAVVPAMPRMRNAMSLPVLSLVRFPDGQDNDDLYRDFKVSGKATPGSANILQEKR